MNMPEGSAPRSLLFDRNMVDGGGWLWVFLFRFVDRAECLFTPCGCGSGVDWMAASLLELVIVCD
jgi:hypothetical protein